MTKEPRPAKRAFVTIDDVRWELVATDKLSFPETKEVKRVTEGMSLRELSVGIANADGDAWLAWMYVSIRRKRPTLTYDEFVRSIGDTPVGEILETVEEEASEVADPDPPAHQPLNDSGETLSGNGSGEKIPPISTLATAGPPT